jgi:hypothetical protein
MPQEVIRVDRIFRLVALSSTINIRTPSRIASSSLLSRSFPACFLRNIKTDELAKKMLAYKNKPVESWRADDWGLLDALNPLVGGKATVEKVLLGLSGVLFEMATKHGDDRWGRRIAKVEWRNS